ncbi:MAG TPA: hypothetical protein VFW96_05280 [Thermomicrobiales bacterium]|nr:hypothetical protein [Thermomicrobiales bacterium]
MRLGATVPFAEAAAVLGLALGLRVSPATVRRHTAAAGAVALRAEAAELARVEQALPVAATPPERLQLSLDATTVSLVGGGWTDVKLATFGELVPGRDAAGQPLLQAERVSDAARGEPADQFGRTLTLEANRRGRDEAGLVLGVTDGADWIQGPLDRIAPRALRLLDEIHAAEHRRAIADLACGAGTPAARAWTDEQRLQLQLAPPAALVAERARRRAAGPCPGAPDGPGGLPPRAWLARAVAYFEQRAAQIADAAFREQGDPIGSGIVERGHRVVIGARLQGAGQHWAPASLNPLLVLRTAICNDRWAATWPALRAARRQDAVAAARARRPHRRPPPRPRRGPGAWSPAGRPPTTPGVAPPPASSPAPPAPKL